MKSLLKKLIPKPILSAYHRLLAIAANIYYGFPSRKLIVVGVTGTKGKSSTVVMITRILEEAGFQVGSTNTIFFKIGEKEFVNNYKQGMPGRFRLQKLLNKMVKKGCTHAVVEVTSEGVLQSRHWGIAFDTVVFTNISPEHIEAHGSFANYRDAKAQIFKGLNNSYRKVLNGQRVKKAMVINREDEEAFYFSQFPADEKWGVWELCAHVESVAEKERTVCAEKITESTAGVAIILHNKLIQLKLLGRRMAANALVAIGAAQSLGVEMAVCEQALEKLEFLPGRMERIKEGQDFEVIVDYAHEPASFESALKTARALAGPASRVITVFGATGGGRDKGKRPIMGRLAARFSDCVILTTDDPYHDDPEKLMADIEPGLKEEDKEWERVLDRKEAITRAIHMAKTGDVVMILGKGSETVMAVRGKLIPWSDKEIAKSCLSSISRV